MQDPDVLRVTDDFVFFWRPPAPFGQWTPSRFTVAGDTYHCAEQFMMAEKARLFGDTTTRTQIMATPDPRAHKRLGRQVKGFTDDRWKANREEIVFQGNVAKFSQNQSFLDALRATGEKMLVEASPYDRIWGIGLKSMDPHAEDPSHWRGLNLLGIALMRVRAHLLHG